MITVGKEKNMKFIKSEANGCTVYMQDSKEIDVNKIPETEMKLLAESILEAAEEYFKQPGVKEKFQEWLRNRKISDWTE